MPLEIRTCDGRHFARPVVQNHALLPLERLVTPHERQRRQLKFAFFLILFSAALIAAAVFLKGF